MAELKRSLGLWGAVDIGVGAIIGAGIFVLSGVTAFLTALSSAELSSFITEAGGSFIYAEQAFGKGWGFLVGWTKSFDYIVGASVVSIGFASYLTFFTGMGGDTATVVLVAAVLPLVFLTVNLLGVREAGGANNALVVLKIAALVIFIAIGTNHILTAGDLSNYTPFFPKGVGGTLSASAVIFFAYIGFNTITVLSEEVKEPKRNVPKAIILAFLVSTLLYVGVSTVEVGLISWDQIAGSAAPLDAALRQATSSELVLGFVSVSALFATASVVMSSMLGGSRALFAMGRKGVLPKSFARVSGRGVPVTTVVLAGLSMAAVVLLTRGDIALLASAFNFGTLITFLFINLSLIKLRRSRPGAPRSFRVPLYPAPPALGILSCLALMAFLNPNAIIIGLAWIALGYLVYHRSRRKGEGSAAQGGDQHV